MKPVTNGIVKGTRTEGTLLAEPIPRKTRKSAFLRKLERAQEHRHNVIAFKRAVQRGKL